VRLQRLFWENLLTFQFWTFLKMSIFQNPSDFLFEIVELYILLKKELKEREGVSQNNIFQNYLKNRTTSIHISIAYFERMGLFSLNYN
jgi:hypothetical protein